MNIPDTAIVVAADVLEELDSLDMTTVAEAALTAALPHLLADYRARLVKAAGELAVLADKQTDMGGSYFRVCGKAEGVRLALSYLDELTR